MRKAIIGSAWTSRLVCLVSRLLGSLKEKMLNRIFGEVALEREVEGDLFLHDIGQGFGFRPGSFDGAIRYALFISIHP